MGGSQQKSTSKKAEDDHILITPSIENVYNKAAKLAVTDVTALILGESGTGKEHLAGYIHKESTRKGKPFIAINCSAFNDSLLESRLFGYKKGAFTGAEKDTPGLLEEAKGGTVFMDEIGDISPYMQQSLLRVLQQKVITPVGGKPVTIDVRFIAATNRDLAKLCQEGKFRWDLYYRLAIAELELPALINRGTKEIEALLDYFLKIKKDLFKRSHKLKLSKEAKQFLLQYTWPGNIREMENLVESLYVFSEGEVNIEDIPHRFRILSEENSLLWKDIEKEHIKKVLKLKNGNISQTQKALGYGSLNTLKSKLDEYKINI